MKRLIIIAFMLAACNASATWGGFQAYVTPAGGVIPTSDLILQYLMGANGSESTITLDTSGNNYTGTVSGATWNQATNGITDLYDFDGANDLITVPVAVSTTVNGSKAITYSMWVKPDAISTLDGFLVSRGAELNKIGASATDSTEILFTADYGGNGRQSIESTSSPLSNGKWTHVACVVDTLNSNQSLYVDGQLEIKLGGAPAPSWSLTADDNFKIATDDGSSGRWLNGQMALVSIATNALTASEVLATNRTQAVELGILSEYVNENLADGLVFDDEGNSLLTEGSTNSIAITTASAPTQLGDSTNGWQGYNGVANYKQFPDTKLPSGSSARTLNFRFSHSANSTDVLFEYGQNSIGKRIAIYYFSGSYYIDFNTLTLAFTHTHDTDWHMLTLVIPEGAKISECIVYFDGIEQSTTRAGSDLVVDTILSTPAVIGSSRAGASHWEGNIDQIPIWNTALTSNQVFNLYNAGRGN